MFAYSQRNVLRQTFPEETRTFVCIHFYLRWPDRKWRLKLNEFVLTCEQINDFTWESEKVIQFAGWNLYPRDV